MPEHYIFTVKLVTAFIHNTFVLEDFNFDCDLNLYSAVHVFCQNCQTPPKCLHRGNFTTKFRKWSSPQFQAVYPPLNRLKRVPEFG